ncbi:MAG: hypothetical protein P4N41_17990 [Negativicutes bacterium]|nr:hypothetical protein [Negativicutes bacterium]
MQTEHTKYRGPPWSLDRLAGGWLMGLCSVLRFFDIWNKFPALVNTTTRVIVVRIIVSLIYVAAAWKWSKWKDWQKYYPTYLFMLASNFFGAILAHNHTLWKFSPSFFLPNHTFSDIWIALVSFPSVSLLYLSRYPENGVFLQVGWIILWTCITTLNEAMAFSIGNISYDHDWSLAWSAAFNLTMFITLRVHFLNPLAAWVLSAVVSLFIWNYFGFNIEEMK